MKSPDSVCDNPASGTVTLFSRRATTFTPLRRPHEARVALLGDGDPMAPALPPASPPPRQSVAVVTETRPLRRLLPRPLMAPPTACPAPSSLLAQRRRPPRASQKRQQVPWSRRASKPQRPPSERATRSRQATCVPAVGGKGGDDTRWRHSGFRAENEWQGRWSKCRGIEPTCLDSGCLSRSRSSWHR